ncbi:lytic murein transglycosylase B [Gynuella sunshinyii]|uniref:Membrane-bound lytic murein transglycosylase B n=1 Tax=Gynuella sunshinyii YC6258 TaxID=1445510 RepID=A0A0C5VJJ8_9GAMM|nr:lytic murein transglycosylase B [Gynuella sunshinyii]AJQ94466.1 membrane-bound lytic murein transglycosylase B [Gynuella sunshinyii YC6258]
MTKILYLFFWCCLPFLSVQTLAETFVDNPDVKTFTAKLVAEDGFSQQQLDEWFGQVRYQASIIEAFNRPKETTSSYKSYKPMFVSPETMARGKAFAETYRVALTRAEYVYGVPAEVILAVIAIESRFGRTMGGYRVFDALATTGFYYPRRADYFQKELREFLLISRDQKIDPFSVKGSYAGAMGYPQFMPSSFRAYAVDFDFDDHIDIWDNPVDAIGSIANYFKVHGWTKDALVAVKASVSGDQYDSLIADSMKLGATVEEVINSGWKLEQDIADKQQQTIPFKVETDAGMEYWVGLKNFYVITRYNHSRLYALTVHHLGLEFQSLFGQ